MADTLAANATKAQALAYLAANYGKAVYHNTAKTPYEGKNYSALYSYIEAQNPSAAPHDIAVAVADLLLSSAVGSAIGQGAGEAAGAVAASATGIETAQYLPSWAVPFADFLGVLENGNTWLRIAEGILGVVLIAVGLARLTHAVPIATKIAGAVA